MLLLAKMQFLITTETAFPKTQGKHVEGPSLNISLTPSVIVIVLILWGFPLYSLCLVNIKA